MISRYRHVLGCAQTGLHFVISMIDTIHVYNDMMRHGLPRAFANFEKQN
jgi:hypothetical protein